MNIIYELISCRWSKEKDFERFDGKSYAVFNRRCSNCPYYKVGIPTICNLERVFLEKPTAPLIT